MSSTRKNKNNKETENPQTFKGCIDKKRQTKGNESI